VTVRAPLASATSAGTSRDEQTATAAAAASQRRVRAIGRLSSGMRSANTSPPESDAHRKKLRLLDERAMNGQEPERGVAIGEDESRRLICRPA